MLHVTNQPSVLVCLSYHTFISHASYCISMQSTNLPLLDYLCPKCRQTFDNSRAVLAHLNSRFSSCYGQLDDYDAISAFAEEATKRHAENGLNAFQSHIPPSPSPPPPPPPPPPPILEASAPSTFAEYHPHSSFCYGQGANTFERVQNDDFARRQGVNPYYPFKGQEEWELACFLARSSLSQTEIDEFLKLAWVTHSFMSTLFGHA
jgi:hypothetical protein